MRLPISALSGGLFGLGLFVGGMTDTRKVQGFLDIFGAWDPTLAFVMGGAILPMVVAWRIARSRATAWSGARMPAPARTQVDAPLLVGAVLFGAGWALVGLCPGPAIASLSFGGWQGLIFLAAMLAGMAGLRIQAARGRADA